MRIMHVCVKCAKKYATLEHIHSSCECGASVFIFTGDDKDIEEDRKWLRQELEHTKQDASKGPVSIDIANVRILRKGVYTINVSALFENPVIVKDSSGIYYIKLPKTK